MLVGTMVVTRLPHTSLRFNDGNISGKLRVLMTLTNDLTKFNLKNIRGTKFNLKNIRGELGTS